MAKPQKAKINRVRRRTHNRTETRAAALARGSHTGPMVARIVARKSTRNHGEVRVEVGANGVRVVSGNHSLPMYDEDSALKWLDNL